jgi:hypothetical protein
MAYVDPQGATGDRSEEQAADWKVCKLQNNNDLEIDLGEGV